MGGAVGRAEREQHVCAPGKAMHVLWTGLYWCSAEISGYWGHLISE
jgi:hypothetical protein